MGLPGAPSALAAAPPAGLRGRREPTITPAELLARGIPRTTFANWVTAGHLGRTGERGVYVLTPAAEARIAAFLSARR